jgi:hypothetical protein
LLQWDFAAVQRCNSLRRMSHLLPDHSRVDTGEFPSPVAAPTEPVQAAFRQAE